MGKEKQELAKPNTGLALPDYMQHSTEGHEQIDQDDMRMPRLKVLQPLSHEVQQEDSDLRPGMMVNSVTQQVIPKGVKGVIIATRRLRNLWRDPGSGEGIVCHSPDARVAMNPNGVDGAGNSTNDCSACIKSKFTKQGDRNVAPECTEYREFMFLLEGEAMPLVVSMGKSTAKAARKLAQKLNADMGVKNLPIYAFQFELSVVDRVNNANKKWWEIDIRPAGFAERELYEAAASAYGANKDRLKTIAVGEIVTIEGGADAPAM